MLGRDRHVAAVFHEEAAPLRVVPLELLICPSWIRTVPVGISAHMSDRPGRQLVDGGCLKRRGAELEAAVDELDAVDRLLSLVVIVVGTTAARSCPSASGPAVSQPLGTVVFGSAPSGDSIRLAAAALASRRTTGSGRYA